MKSIDEMRAHVLEKAADDLSFRAELISDTRGVLENEFDIRIPDSISVHVHADDPVNFHLVLPPTSELDTGTLEEISGGGPGLKTIYGELP